MKDNNATHLRKLLKEFQHEHLYGGNYKKWGYRLLILAPILWVIIFQTNWTDDWISFESPHLLGLFWSLPIFAFFGGLLLIGISESNTKVKVRDELLATLARVIIDEKQNTPE